MCTSYPDSVGINVPVHLEVKFLSVSGMWGNKYFFKVGFGWLWSAHKKIQKVSRDPGIPGLDFGSEVSNANKLSTSTAIYG